MPTSTRRLAIAVLLLIISVAVSSLAYSQVSVRPVPVDPVVLTGSDLGFRVTAFKRGTPVGQLVVRIDGEWKEVEFSYRVQQVTK